MEAVTGAMSTLLPKLANLIKKEYNLHKSLRAEITSLSTELEYMEAALLMVSEAPIDNPPSSLDKLWARDVRQLSYDLEDSIDSFMVHIDNHAPTNAKTHSFLDSVKRGLKLLRRVKTRHTIGVDVDGYKRRIEEVKERRDRYKVDPTATKPPAGPTVLHGLSALYTEVSKLVGTEERIDELVKMLMEVDEAASNDQPKIVSIFGSGGLGKTTLARLVYEKLRGQFDCGVIVTISRSPNLQNILKDILHGCGYSCKNDFDWGEVELINQLRRKLRRKRYFIVVDDIWETRVWEEALQYALTDNEHQSRVIITTRNLDVAKKVGNVYKLQPLSHGDSRKLFNLRIFGPKENCLPNELAEVSENILKKCGGVPLAIVMIASMLASGKENTHKYWSQVYKIMGSGLEDSPDIIKDMRRILLISYYDMPPHLKTCMLYLGSYPEDHHIPAKYLIKKWVGEGFIVLKEHGKSFYEVGEDYINELINRSMIQPSHIDHESNKVIYFRVHDMVLDLITHLSNEDGFLTALDGQRPIYLPKRIRRLSLQTSNDECGEIIKEDIKQLSTVILDHVRSLTVSMEAFDFLPAHLNFHVLRVLDLSGCKQVDDDYFKGICNLFHLRLLGLSSTSITKIPKEIRNLQFLLVLDVSETRVNKLPATFIQLRKLLYLHVDSLMGTPVGFGDLRYLQQLKGTITVESPTMMHDLFELTELRSLNLRFNEWNESYEKSFLKCLSNLVCLEYLQLEGCNGSLGYQCDMLTPGPQQLRTMQIASDTIVHQVPRWMSSLCALSILHITLLTLEAEDLHLLGSIPLLSHLQINVEEEEPTEGKAQRLVITDDYPFLSLTKFDIQKNTGVAFSQGAMPKLQILEFVVGVQEIVDRFGDLDFGLENLSSLVEVKAWISCPIGDSDKARAAENAIRKALHANPNKPTLYCEMTNWLKMHIYCEDKIEEILNVIDGVDEKSIDPQQGKVTVSGYIDPTSIMVELNKAGILVQHVSYSYRKIPSCRFSPQYPSYANYDRRYYVYGGDTQSCSVM